MQMSIEADVYTTHDRVTFAVMDPSGEPGQLVVEIAPGETKSVTLPPNGKVVTIHRPLSTVVSQFKLRHYPQHEQRRTGVESATWLGSQVAAADPSVRLSTRIQDTEPCWGNVHAVGEIDLGDDFVWAHACEGHEDIHDGGKYKPEPERGRE